MTGVGRKDRAEEFFNLARTSDAFRKLFPNVFAREVPFWETVRVDGNLKSAFGKISRGDDDFAARSLAEIHDACWLTWDDPRQRTDVKRLGCWGQCLALGVLWSLVQQDHVDSPMSIAVLANHALKHGGAHGLIPDVEPKHPLTTETAQRSTKVRVRDLQGKLCNTYSETLTLFLKTRQDNASIPCVAMAEVVHKCLLSFVFSHLTNSVSFKPSAGITEEYLAEHLRETDYATPMACFDGMVKALGLRQSVMRHNEIVPVQAGHSWVEPSIWRYVTSSESDKRQISDGDIEKAVHDIDTNLSLQTAPSENARRLTVLTGSTHSGKKAVVGDFLKLIYDRSGSEDIRFTLQNRSRRSKPDLPVLCLQTKDRDAVTLCIEVLVFLLRLSEKKPPPQDQACQARWALLDQSGSAQRLSDLLTLINEAHQEHPALFVFLDVQPPANTDIRNLMNKTRMDNLVNVLLRGHQDSRFLVTTQDASKTMETVDCHPIPLERPTLKRLNWYLNDQEEEQFAACATEFGFDAYKGRKIDGNVLMVLSVLFSEDSMDPVGFFALMEECSEQSATAGTKSLEMLCKHLIANWKESGLLPYLALILASDDGMMRSTLIELSADWRSRRPELSAVDITKGLEMIDGLTKCGRGLFLRQLPPQVFMTEELRFSEPDFDVAHDDYRTWNFDSGLIKTLRTLITEEKTTRDMMREAHRLVAGAARSRARHQQLKGFTVRREFGPRLPERSVQAFVSLMLSLKGEFTYSDSVTDFARSVPLPLSTRRVFSLSDSEFDQSAALRYAYHVLIGKEADPKHKLSMTLDADVLRLQLFSLLCSDPGDIKVWDDSWFALNKGRLPSELADAKLAHFAVFPNSERADILTSLAMAAFYCNQRPILLWAETKLFELHTTNEPLSEQLSRVVCARVDLECQIGHPIKRSKAAEHSMEPIKYGSVYDEQHFLNVRDNLEEDIETICRKVSKSENLEQDLTRFTFSEMSAWLRMQTRLLYLDGLIDPNAEVWVRAAELITLENSYLAKHKSPRSIAQHGRTGRMLFKSRSQHYPILPSNVPQNSPQSVFSDQFKGEMRAMIHANVSRLSQFSGAERALSLNDHANYLMMSGDLASAVKAVAEARRVAFQGMSSDSIRLDVLMLDCAIQLACAEAEGVSTAQLQVHLEIALQNLGLIQRMLVAKNLSFEEVYMRVLAWRVCQIGASLQMDLAGWDSIDQKAKAIEKAETHEAIALANQLKRLKM